MEDGLQVALSTVSADDSKNGVSPTVMANFPEGTVASNRNEKNFLEQEDVGPKLNGSIHSSDEADEDSETNALVIDESAPKRRVKKRKRNNKLKSACGDNSVEKESEVVLHSNPYFNESLFELSQQHNAHNENEPSSVTDKNKTVNCVNKSKRVKPKSSPKLREYAQYLGLQPAVQFKCSKCRRSGFESLPSLNDHLVNCTADPSASIEVEDNSVSSFKLTRKVFLCSACGTYYENWNLYMHMLEFHRRFICLYCLGMFSVLDDLCQHIQSRHNWEPQQRATPDDFFKEYKEPCFIICCECKKLFSEQDNFFYHKCTQSDSTTKNTSGKNIKNKSAKQLIRPENHVTGDSVTDNLSEISSEVVSKCPAKNTNSPMVRSEANYSEAPEILPDIPTFDQHINDSHTSLQVLDQFENSESSDSHEKHLQKQDDTMNELLSMETHDKQTSLNLTSDLVNQNRTERIEYDDDSINANISSPNYFEKPIFDQSSRDSDLKSNMGENSDVDENLSRDVESMNEEESNEPLETRKVPKLSLKLPKLDILPNMELEDSEDSDKFGGEVDQIESESEYFGEAADEKMEDTFCEPQIQVAGLDVSIVELELEQPLDKFEIKVLLQKCLLATVPNCVYCNHARKIAVNGKQLGLHAISEHRYSAIVKSITAEELIPESFVNRIKESLDELEGIFFNLESNLSEEAVTFSHVFECFQCRYSTAIHKELYLHNRKMHTKNLLLCIMCKSNFYNYSELICHLCPGDYVLDYDVQFRCCMCVGDDLPSAFRLMVHLRKRHHVCDVCLEMCHTQYKLSNHVWKHKLHHFCYRCGIAYRNKQDITRHLYWKHGTESVLCKKCLQKKWPHVFHFCIPPSTFSCEECNLNFTKAVYVKVHRRIHSNEKPHSCLFEGCNEKFVSKKLLQKHEIKHLEPSEEIKNEVQETENMEENPGVGKDQTPINMDADKIEEKPKPKVDVYDLPELNLSESSDSEPENEVPKQVLKKTEEENIIETLDERTLEVEQELANSITLANNEIQDDEEVSSVPILESIWDDFKIYQAKKEKTDHMFIEPQKDFPSEEKSEVQGENIALHIALMDHDYFPSSEVSQDTNVITEVTPDLSQRVDHDYCTHKDTAEGLEKEKAKDEGTGAKKATNSDFSSSDSDSTSCSCGSNCSCSSSSSSSSSSDSSDSESSTEEGRKKQQARREKKKMKLKVEKQEQVTTVADVHGEEEKPIVEAPILETDLDTTESETDEEFYDRQPQTFAKKLLEEKRNQIIAEVGSLPNGSFFENSRNSTPSLPEEVKPKKKSKSKKRKKKRSERKEVNNEDYEQPNVPYLPNPTVAPLTISLNRMSPLAGSPNAPMISPKVVAESTPSRQETDLNLRASKRRRVPNKFYGYSSDEEGEKHTPSKWRKVESQMQPISFPQPPLIVPPITIKTGPIMPQPTVEPITIRPTAKPGELRVHHKQSVPPRVPPLQINTSLLPRSVSEEHDSGSESNDSPVEEPEVEPVELPKENTNVQLYCYCRCPYDEVSEMIGCDSHDCAIEWFHFECVGIMVPPKGQWFCPDCRKRKQQRRELLQV